MTPKPLITALAALLTLTGCLSFHQGPLPGEPPQATFYQVKDARLRVVVQGPEDAPAVVFIHGFAASANTWAAVMPALAKDHRVIALDLKGFGWSNRPPGDYSPQAQAALVLGVMDQLGVHQAALVAHSWGSSVALALALKSPERVRRIALYDAWVYESQLPTFFLWARTSSLGELLFALFYTEQPGLKIQEAFYDPRFVTQALVDDVDTNIKRPGTSAAALAAVRGQRYALIEARYREITAPVLLLWGREDKVTPLVVGERLVSELPDARLQVYARCGHFPMIEAYAASTRALADFLAEDQPVAADATPPTPPITAPDASGVTP